MSNTILPFSTLYNAGASKYFTVEIKKDSALDVPKKISFGLFNKRKKYTEWLATSFDDEVRIKTIAGIFEIGLKKGAISLKYYNWVSYPWVTEAVIAFMTEHQDALRLMIPYLNSSAVWTEAGTGGDGSTSTNVVKTLGDLPENDRNQILELLKKQEETPSEENTNWAPLGYGRQGGFKPDEVPVAIAYTSPNKSAIHLQSMTLPITNHRENRDELLNALKDGATVDHLLTLREALRLNSTPPLSSETMDRIRTAAKETDITFTVPSVNQSQDVDNFINVHKPQPTPDGCTTVEHTKIRNSSLSGTICNPKFASSELTTACLVIPEESNSFKCGSDSSIDSSPLGTE